MDNRSYKKLQRLLNEFPKTVQDIAEKNDYKYQKRAKRDMAGIARTVIDKFYEGYTPYIYDRWGDLYNTYKIIVNNKIWKIDYSYKYMKYEHRVSNKYIYQWSFIFGYHGGAFDGPGHPEENVPYYRSFPYYKSWSYPAFREDFSPYLLIEERIKDYFYQTNIDLNLDFKKKVLPYMNEIKTQIAKTFK